MTTLHESVQIEHTMDDQLFDLLKREMQSRRWNVSRLAEACHADIALASRWVAENPERRVVPGPKSCQKIATALGLDPDYVLELAGHRKPVTPRAEGDARHQARVAELEGWLAAVGPEFEDDYWLALRASHETNLRLLNRVRTAVSAGGDGAVSAAVSGRAKRGRSSRDSSGGPLAASQHTLARALAHRELRTNARLAA